jgi:hypothetical protein
MRQDKQVALGAVGGGSIMHVMPVRIIHITIRRPWQQVFGFASDPANMQAWASGLAAGLVRDGSDWIGDGGPIGQVRVKFTPPNEFGILDHTVTMEDGTVVMNPMRVMPNGEGAEVLFVLFRRADQTDADFAADAAHILKDLTTLKTLLESFDNGR